MRLGDNGTAVIQKQPPEVFCKTKMFLKFRKIHKKLPVLESLY